MGNDLADAIRDELKSELLAKYGDLQAAAKALGMTYKTLYRILTTKGADRAETVKLDRVIEIAEHLESVGRDGFNTIYARAASRRSADRGEGTYDGE